MRRVVRSITTWTAICRDAEAMQGVLVFDVENTLIDYGIVASDLACALRVAVGALPPGRVVLVSNSRLPLGEVVGRDVPTFTRARKPWTSKAQIRAAAAGQRIAAVIGDQPLTDGLLAWHLGVPWLQLVRQRNEPLWPRVLRFVGGLLVPFFFVSEEQT